MVTKNWSVHGYPHRATRTLSDDEISVTWTLVDPGVPADAESIILALNLHYLQDLGADRLRFLNLESQNMWAYRLSERCGLFLLLYMSPCLPKRVRQTKGSGGDGIIPATQEVK